MSAFITKAIGKPGAVLSSLKYRIENAWIALQNRLHTSGRPVKYSELPALRDIEVRAETPTDISDHLVTMFHEALTVYPRLIVELGVRGGESTFVFERVCRLCGSSIISVDIENCLQASGYEKWNFVQSDDIRFAGEFTEFCAAKGVEPVIDVLFIDTSHEYAHTVEEIRSWFPFLAARGKVLFHDTNLQPMGRRRDGRLLRGMDNHRNVIRAIEEFLGVSLDESQDFIRVYGNWLVKHSAFCNGLTILERLELCKDATNSRPDRLK